MKVAVITAVIGAPETTPKELLTGLEDLKFWGQVESIQTTEFIKIDQNTEKTTGDWRRLTVT